MVFLDYSVLILYFAILIGIGIWSSMRIKKQEDFFMGGRSFGKWLQTFAAFGAGTGSSDPVNTGRTTFTSGMSGMWSVMYWLFVTPFYWITGVWYRRMRHLTLGDWFVERYQSQALGVGYAIYGILFFMLYGSMLFSAIGKVAAPLMDVQPFMLMGYQFDETNIQYLLVPIIGVIVLGYGILGGLQAAYFTDLIQGLCIIVLSIILVPFGLNALVEKFGDPAVQSTMDGFRIMHEQLPKDYFSVVGSNSGSEFPLHRILAVVLINLVGIVVQPHFIATGGGSAKDENTARIGLVTGNFLKRFCTIGWVLTALIVLALYADNPRLLADPDRTWGVASRELLGPGLAGLMLACLLAALMSSVDAYMIVGSALVVRNIYKPYIKPDATEKQYVTLARFTGIFIVAGAVVISLSIMDVFKQLELTWVLPVLFAAPFWIGMYWRRATTTAAWSTVVFCALMFWIVPFTAPRISPDLRSSESYLTTNQTVQTTVRRPAAPADVARENANAADMLEAWDENKSGPMPNIEKLEIGDEYVKVSTSKATSVFWTGGVKPVDDDGNALKVQIVNQPYSADQSSIIVDDEGKPFAAMMYPAGEAEEMDVHTTRQILQFGPDVKLKGFGNFRLDFLLYQIIGMDLTTKTNATISTLELPPKIITPFLVMILISFLTRKNKKEALDRYYSKMKTPVVPDPKTDDANLEEAFKNIEELESKKLFPRSSLEFQKPSKTDIIGFIVCVLACFGIIGLAILVTSIGS